MSERITEAELADWISEWQAIIERARGPDFMAEPQFGLRLVSEIRRLRGLIREGGAGQVWTSALETEAQAIAEEQKGT